MTVIPAEKTPAKHDIDWAGIIETALTNIKVRIK